MIRKGEKGSLDSILTKNISSFERDAKEDLEVIRKNTIIRGKDYL